MRSYWGTQMSMVFQDPMTSLNPVMQIGKQITESLRYHLDVSKRLRRGDRAGAARSRSGSPRPSAGSREYPHQLSGGMRQRVMIAIALACGPKLLFADEPTTALDVTVQAQILDLLQAQQRERFMAMVLVTHDLGVVAGRADDIAVMYAGRIVEKAPTRALFSETRHPYTEALLKSIPKLAQPSHTRLEAISGRPPDLVNPPPGCKFAAALPVRAAALRRRGAPLGDAESRRPRVPLLLSRSAPRPGRTRSRATSPRASPRPGCRSAARRARSRRPRRWWPDGRHRYRTSPAAEDESLLRVEDLVVEFPVGRTGLKVNAVTEHQPRRDAGRDARARRRVGLRQVDHRQGDHAAAAPKSGQVLFDGIDMTKLDGRRAARARARA